MEIQGNSGKHRMDIKVNNQVSVKLGREKNSSLLN